MNSLTFETIIEFFSKLPPEGTHEYEKMIFKYSEHCSDSEYLEVFQHMISCDNDWAYEAFYLLCSYYKSLKITLF